MSRKLFGSVVVMTLSLAVSFTYGEPRRGGGGGERSSEGERSSGERSGGERSGSQGKNGKKPPGGSWSEYNHLGTQSKEKSDNARNESGAEGEAAEKNKNSQPSGAEGAAAGAAHSNRNSPQASGAEGAAAGAAASNRNNPQYSGAQGAAAGAAASNRNNPQYSGAQGAAAGAAVSSRNNPQYSGAQGAAAGAAVANRNQPQYSGAQGAAVVAGYAGVRNNVDHPGMYGQQWYGEHQSAWAPSGWVAGAAWTPATWQGVSTQFGYDIDTTPIVYNYGSNVTCIDGKVVVDGQPVGTAEEFSLQADEIAATGTSAMAPADGKWLPLGVFALVRNEQQHPQLIMQLAVNEQGIVRGNYTDEVTDTTLPVHGAIDRKTQRAAWTIGDNKYSVMEAGLNNLTQGELPALIHKNGTTQRWLLVRLAQPTAGGK